MTAVRVVVGTFGNPEWAAKATPAVQSAIGQTVSCEVVHVHARSLGHARNLGGMAPGADWLVFLDADDTLDAGYVEAMLSAGKGDLRQPATLGVHPDGHEDLKGPTVIPYKPLMDGNYMVIGTMIRADLFRTVGGFDETLPIYEDWDLWIRCRLQRVTIAQVGHAVYRVGVNPGSRNQGERSQQLEWYHAIRARHAVRARELAADGFII